MKRRNFLTGGLLALASPAFAFGPGMPWQSQGFLFQRENRFEVDGQRLVVESDAAASLFLGTVPETLWDTRRASWHWQVSQGVPATDLSGKGGDDRDLSIYFLFLPQDRARALQGASTYRLLTEQSTRSLLYVWGGDKPRGTLMPSPYMDGRGTTIVLRSAGVGTFDESVDLEADFRSAFKSEPDVLFGVAVSADSDDTSSHIRASKAYPSESGLSRYGV